LKSAAPKNKAPFDWAQGAFAVARIGDPGYNFMRSDCQDPANDLTIPLRCGIIGRMDLKITPWNKPAPPTESELLEIYRQEGLSPYAWSNSPGDVYSAHTHSYHKVLYVVRGSITWLLPETGQAIETNPGDRIDLPRGTLHGARVGPGGVTCLEAHLP
jgi:quercetin dioxygenase-like cupin family protein